MEFQAIEKKTSTFHDFPYDCPQRKCIHTWVINTGPPGRIHCIHDCLYCYARESIYSRESLSPQYYNNLPELVEKDLERMNLCPPISISNATDPCQAVPGMRVETERLVALLLRRGVSFSITTKGDARFLLDAPGFVEFNRKAVAITIEGDAKTLSLLSPGAPPFDERLRVVEALASRGTMVSVRLDPFFIHLARAIHPESWRERLESLIHKFADAGARHLIVSTGRLSRKASRSSGQWESIWTRVRNVIARFSMEEASRFENDYEYSKEYTSQGFLLRKDPRLEFHRQARNFAESIGMTYATCQETHARETDSENIPHCEGFRLPFARKGADGLFHAIDGCDANCHVSCRGRNSPPCGVPGLITTSPMKRSMMNL